jgi:hypothetical protein
MRPWPPVWETLDSETIGIAPRWCGVCGAPINPLVAVLGPDRTIHDVARACAQLIAGNGGCDYVIID